jgi:predicted Zn-dependent protease
MAALEIRPECQTALTGIAVSYYADDNIDEAIKYGKASAASAPGYAAGQYLLSAVLLEARQSTAAKAALEAAKAADPGQLAIQTIPSKARAMNYYFRTGRLPLLNLSQAQQD